MTGESMTGEQRDRQPPASYQVRVRGHLGAAMRRAFPALHAETRGQDTLLQGVADQASLHGVLARIEALGLELIEVRRLAGGPKTSRNQEPGKEPSWRERGASSRERLR